jgi:O-antigen ligase
LHDNFVQLGADRGLPALAVWIWFMGVLGWQILKTRNRLHEGKWIAHAGLACWFGFLAEGLFEFNFGTSPVLMLFLFMAASPFAAEQIELEPASPSPHRRLLRNRRWQGSAWGDRIVPPETNLNQ